MTQSDPTQGSRLTPAWNTALTTLADGAWHPWTDLVTAMTNASDIKPVSASNLLHDAVRHGTLQRQGEHRDRTRQIRLAQTP
ncbi:hypothetical protein [Streptomyces sp. NPDC059928]|uniref:hypothetical protein n=1 Tax=unclassified Streptomyces TaxID=2593676 RepID=UPI003665C1D1